MSWGIGVEMIDTDDLVVRSRRQPTPIGRKPDSMDSARVIAHMA